MNLQEFHDRYTLRVKYAISTDNDLTKYKSINTDCNPLWTALPEGWKIIEEGGVLPRTDTVEHPARLISTPSGDVLAVEHETGLEIVAVGAAVVSAAAAVVGLFQTWRSNRRTPLTPIQGRDAMVIEVRVQKPNGVITTTTTTIPAHLVTDKEVARLLSGG